MRKTIRKVTMVVPGRDRGPAAAGTAQVCRNFVYTEHVAGWRARRVEACPAREAKRRGERARP
jgi:hypothetical protein